MAGDRTAPRMEKTTPGAAAATGEEAQEVFAFRPVAAEVEGQPDLNAERDEGAGEEKPGEKRHCVWPCHPALLSTSGVDSVLRSMIAYAEETTMPNLTVRERFRRTMRFEPVDRLPVIEWAPWWREKTIARWRQEGLPEHLQTNWEIGAFFGLDDHRQCWMRTVWPGAEIDGTVTDAVSYERCLPFLYPAGLAGSPYPVETLREWAAIQEKGHTFVWLTLEGAFWFPRRLFGIERHFYAFYDEPELMERVISDLAAYCARTISEFWSVCPPEFVMFTEDMSYNHGPMLSKSLFDRFIAPFYRRVVPEIERRGSFVIVDSDGDITQMVPWFAEVGVHGFLPLERQAGVDIGRLREISPRCRFIGHFDKMVMHRGQEAVRREFERLLPVMRQGGYVASVDHQTPPEVSLEDYRQYVRLLKEYCRKAGAG